MAAATGASASTGDRPIATVFHEVETWSTGEKPTTKPWPELIRARYTPAVSCNLARKSPLASTTALANGGQGLSLLFLDQDSCPGERHRSNVAAEPVWGWCQIETRERCDGGADGLGVHLAHARGGSGW